MTDGEALFRSVCDTPRDDLPRLVYADWLDEHDQPERAEFIRLQCEAHEYCRRFPSLAHARTHASQLAHTLGDQWYAELPSLDGVAWSSLWVRGFIDRAWVRSPTVFLVAGERLFNATPLLHVCVDAVAAVHIERMFASPFLGRLATFRFSHERLTRVDEERIAELQRTFPHIRLEAYGQYQQPYFPEQHRRRRR